MVNIITFLIFVFLLNQSKAESTGTWTSAQNRDISWFDAGALTYTLTTPQQLGGFAYLANEQGETFTAKTIKLGADIDLSGHYWFPIGENSHDFKGTFDGNGYVISNIDIEMSDKSYVGFFRNVGSCTIKNVVISGSIKATGLSSSYVFYAGGIAATSSGGQFINCVNLCTMSITVGSSDTNVGGIVGKLVGTTGTIENCRNEGTIIAPTSSSSAAHVGGIFGIADSAHGVFNCINTGTVVGFSVGGIGGAIKYIDVYNSYNTGPITGVYAAGIVCDSYTNHNDYIYNCYNSGSLTGSTAARHICYSWGATAKYCYGSSSINVDLGYSSAYCTKCGKFTSAGAVSGTSIIDMCTTLVCALNAWIDEQDDPSLYNKWKVGGAEAPAIFLLPVSVTVNANQGTASETSMTVYNGEAFGALPEAQRNNYYFVGWFTALEGGSKIEPTTVVLQTQDFTIYAHWLPYVKVTLKPQGGTVSPTSIDVVYTLEYGILPVPTLDNYHFEGWYLQDDTPIQSDTEVQLSTDHDLYAHWRQIHQVTFITHSGAVSSIVTRLHGEAIGTLPSPQQWDQHVFDGWFTENSGGVKVTESTTITTSVQFYEQWSEIVTVTFNANGGSSHDPVTVTHGRPYGVLPSSTKTGYDFLGWFLSSEGNDKVTETSIVEPRIDHVLYAHWKAQSFSIIFDPQGGDDVETVVLEYGKTIPWSSYSTQRTGYVFAGWFVSGKPCSSVPTMPSETVYAVAHWGKQIQITLNACGGEVNPSSVTKISNSALGDDLPVPSRSGYSPAGWFTSCDESGTEIPSSYILDENPRTLYAHWTKKTYYVRFVTNGGEAIDPMPFLFDDPITGLPSSSQVYREGYAFTCWYADPGVSQTFNLQTMPSNDVYVYAGWVQGVKVNLNANGGTSPRSQVYLATGSKYGKMPVPTKEGYAFSGWFTEALQGVKIEENTDFTATSETTLYAHWTINRYSILFEVSGGTPVNPITLNYGDSIVLVATSEKAGFAFNGWFLDSTCLQPMNYARMPAHDVTLYAKWVQSFKVIFDSGGGTSTVQYINLAPGMTYGSYGNFPVASKLGHSFKGWFTQQSGGDQVIETATFLENHDIILYARWEVNSYALAFNSNGGSAVPPQILKFGSVISAPSNVEKEGFLFDGWYLDSGLIYPMNLTTMPAYDLTLYAKWKSGEEAGMKAWEIILAVFGSLFGGVAIVVGAICIVVKFCVAAASKHEKYKRYVEKWQKNACCNVFIGKALEDMGVKKEDGNSTEMQPPGSSSNNTPSNNSSSNNNASSSNMSSSSTTNNQSSSNP